MAAGDPSLSEPQFSTAPHFPSHRGTPLRGGSGSLSSLHPLALQDGSQLAPSSRQSPGWLISQASRRYLPALAVQTSSRFLCSGIPKSLKLAPPAPRTPAADPPRGPPKTHLAPNGCSHGLCGGEVRPAARRPGERRSGPARSRPLPREARPKSGLPPPQVPAHARPPPRPGPRSGHRGEGAGQAPGRGPGVDRLHLGSIACTPEHWARS